MEPQEYKIGSEKMDIHILLKTIYFQHHKTDNIEESDLHERSPAQQ